MPEQEITVKELKKKIDDEDEKICRLIFLSVFLSAVIGLLTLIVYLGVLIFE